MAYWLILASGVLALLNNVITSFSLSSLLTPEELQTLAEGGMDSQSVSTFLTTFGIIVALIGFGVYLLIAVFVRRGKNWARILGTVFAALSVLGMIPMLGTYFSSVLGVVSLISVLLGVAGIVLLYQAPSRPYFRPAAPYLY